MPLSMFLTRHGCSTTEMARDGIGSHGAVWAGVFSRCTVVSSVFMVGDGSSLGLWLWLWLRGGGDAGVQV